MAENTPKKKNKATNGRSPIGNRLFELGNELKRRKIVATKKEFEINLGYSGNSLKTCNISNLSGKSIKALQSRYPEVNINWIETGEGEMFKKDDIAAATSIKFENIKAGGAINLNQGRDQTVGAPAGTDIEYMLRCKMLTEQLEFYKSQIDIYRQENAELRKKIDTLIINGTIGASK